MKKHIEIDIVCDEAEVIHLVWIHALGPDIHVPAFAVFGMVRWVPVPVKIKNSTALRTESRCSHRHGKETDSRHSSAQSGQRTRLAHSPVQTPMTENVNV